MNFNPKNLPDNILKRIPRTDRPAGNAGLTTTEANAKRDGRLEKELQNQIANWLRLNGIFFVRSRMDKKTTVTPGTPDFVFAVQVRDTFTGELRGVPVAMEAKTQTDLSTDQKRVRELMWANGWTWFQVTTLEQVKSIVERIRNDERATECLR